MRALLAIALLAALGWSGYWWIGASAYETGLNGWLAAQRDAGWKAESATLKVVGYPNRFDTKLTDLRLADPNGDWSWSAPQFQVLSLSYKPNHIIAVWPDSQRITTRRGSFEILADLMRGSVVFAPDSKLTLDRSTIEISEARVSGPKGLIATLTSGALSSRRSASPQAPEFAHDLSLELTRMRVPDSFIQALKLKNTLPREVARLSALATFEFDAPWDRTTVADAPRFLGIKITNFLVLWGEAELQASGRIDITRKGYAKGSLDLQVTNWRALLRVLRELGVVDEQSARSLESGLGLVAALGGDPNRLNVPLVFKNQRSFLGPFEIGAAPRLVQRQ